MLFLIINLLFACVQSSILPSITPQKLEKHCRDVIGSPRVEQVADHIWVALGYDLANTIVIRSNVGNIVIDPGMSPLRSKVTRNALLKYSPGPVAAIIYTHSHIDHVGGASVWAEEKTQIWATDNFTNHFFHQYGQFLPAEQRRAAGQFGANVSLEDVPCSGLGRRLDLKAALSNGVILPTHTFSRKKAIRIGDIDLELVEAHGETEDQLFVWLPQEKALFPGDNWYMAFPNLYTIRGTRPRPVHTWIESLDRMRAYDPKLLVPSHTNPLKSQPEIRKALRNYRDGIQWVRDSVIRKANKGESLDHITHSIQLPSHLAQDRSLLEFYGQIDWSARAIYTNELGWFDGSPYQLYSLPPKNRATRMVDQMGGPQEVLKAVEQSDDPRWSLELIHYLEVDKRTKTTLISKQKISALQKLAGKTNNPNGRAYLLQQIYEQKHGRFQLGKPELSNSFLQSIPLNLIFEVMVTRLDPTVSFEVHETVALRFQDINRTVYLTTRYGVLEVRWDTPLPGTPKPLAILTTDGLTWKKLALKQLTPAKALLSGDVQIKGSKMGFTSFIRRFKKGY